MLKEILLIHPVGQVSAFFFGAFNLVTGLTRRCFFLPVHINVGVMFYALVVIGSVVGVVVARSADANTSAMSSPFHVLSAVVLLGVSTCGVVSGFLLLSKAKGYRASILAVHRYCNMFVAALFVLLAVTGLPILVAVL